MPSLSFDLPIPDRNPALVGVARIFTDIVSPPVMFAALGAAVGWAGSSQANNVVAAIVYGLFICAVPLGLVIGLYKAGSISDLHMSGPGERRIPYLVGFLCSAVAWGTTSLLGASLQLRGLAICSTAGLGALGLVDKYWLISNHSASITTVVLFAGLVFGEPVGLSLSPLIAMVFAARLFLGRHTFPQLLAGAVVGAVPVLLLGRLGYLG